MNQWFTTDRLCGAKQILGGCFNVAHRAGRCLKVSDLNALRANESEVLGPKLWTDFFDEMRHFVQEFLFDATARR
jgi:hypothetical protein